MRYFRNNRYYGRHSTCLCLVCHRMQSMPDYGTAFSSNLQRTAGRWVRLIWLLKALRFAPPPKGVCFGPNQSTMTTFMLAETTCTKGGKNRGQLKWAKQWSCENILGYGFLSVLVGRPTTHVLSVTLQLFASRENWQLFFSPMWARGLKESVKQHFSSFSNFQPWIQFLLL